MNSKFFKRFAALLGFALLAAPLAACSKGPKMVDYAHNGSMKLSLEYQEKDFFTSGVGQFDLWMAIDGDTAHFTPKVTRTSSETVKARFYGIDTPESTGRIQEYGKQASNFTKEHLKNAAENGTIVLAGVSSAYAEPTTDSNGRYLCCVWINETTKNAPVDTLVNLNLWIVQEGYSDVGSLDKMPEYGDIFEKAYWQAKELKLKKFSGEKDPYFNYGEYVETDIPDIMREAFHHMADPTHDNAYNGAKVRITGTVSGYANSLLFVQKLDIDEGIYYGINIFCGMTKPGDKYLKPGTVLQLSVTVQESEEFGFQATGAEGHFKILESLAEEDDVHIITKAVDNTDPNTMLHTFEYSVAELNTIANNESTVCIGSPVAISGNVTVNYFNVNRDGNKWTIGFEEASFDLYLTSAFAGDPDAPTATWTKESDWMGKTLRIDMGVYSFHTTTSGKVRYQILLQNNSDLVWVH